MGAGGKPFVFGAGISEFEAHRADASQKKRHDEIAACVAANAPLTVQAAKAAMRLFERDAQDSTQVDALVAQCFDSQDYMEGRRAFLDKRAPQFKGL